MFDAKNPKRGLPQFKKSYVKKEAERLAKGQNPEILFIACSDSRIEPHHITGAKAGDLFILRHIGNIIPPESAHNTVAAGLEYPVIELNIKTIIVFGHSQCGAMAALLNPGMATDLPITAAWVSHSKAILEKIPENCFDTDVAAKENIKLQIEHLKTYPFIAQKLKNHELTIEGWFYDIGKGDISIFDQELNDFCLYQEPEITENCIISPESGINSNNLSRDLSCSALQTQKVPAEEHTKNKAINYSFSNQRVQHTFFAAAKHHYLFSLGHGSDSKPCVGVSSQHF